MKITKTHAATYLRVLIDRASSRWSAKSVLIDQTKVFPNQFLVHDTEAGKHWKITVTEYRGHRPLPESSNER